MLALFYLENLMGDFQYKMEFSIKVKGDTAHLQCFSVYLPCHFFSGIEVRLCILSGQKMLVICKDMDAVSVDMQPCMDALVVYVNSMMYLPNHNYDYKQQHRGGRCNISKYLFRIRLRACVF